MSRRSRTTRASLLRLPIALVLAAFALTIGPSAHGDAGLTGTVTNGTSDRPVAGVPVTLHLYSQQTELSTSTATTNGAGAVTFATPGSGVTDYQLTADYKGTTFRTAVLPASGAPADVPLTVYEPTDDPGHVVLTDWIVWLDEEGTGAAIQHDLQWRNSSKKAYVGSGPGGTGRIVTQVPVQPGATDFQFLGLFLEAPGSVQGSTFVDSAPLPPGTSQATLRYATATPGTLTFPIQFPTTNFQFFAPDGVSVTSDGLTLAGQITDRDITYQVYEAHDLSARDRIQVSLSGLANAGGGRSPLVFLLVGGLIVTLLGAFAVWRLSRARGAEPSGRSASTRRVRGGQRRPVKAKRDRRAAATSSRREAKTSAVSGNGRSAGGRSTSDEDEDEADLLIEEIAALDLTFERGLLDRDTYESLRAAAKRRLLRMRSDHAGRGTAR